MGGSEFSLAPKFFQTDEVEVAVTMTGRIRRLAFRPDENAAAEDFVGVFTSMLPGGGFPPVPRVGKESSYRSGCSIIVFDEDSTNGDTKYGRHASRIAFRIISDVSARLQHNCSPVVSQDND